MQCCQNSTFCLDLANLKINRFYGLALQALRTIRSTVVNLFVPKHSSGPPCRDSELKKGHPDISKQLICTVTPLSNFNFSIVQKQWLVCCLSARSSLIPYKCQMSVNFPHFQLKKYLLLRNHLNPESSSLLTRWLLLSPSLVA